MKVATHAPCATRVPPPRHPRRLPLRRNPKLATFAAFSVIEDVLTSTLNENSAVLRSRNDEEAPK